MLTPYAAGLALLVLLPAGVTLALAFTSWDAITPPRWVGAANLRLLAGDRAFRMALTNSAVFAAIAVPARLALALGLAMLLHRPGRRVGAARTVALLPTAIPEVAYGLLWLWLFNPLAGPINALLTVGGTGGLTAWGDLPPRWLTMPTPARAAIVIMSVFTIGELLVLLIAARRVLPAELYDLAAAEGAGAWQVFRRVTLPLIAPVLALLALRDTVASFHLSFVPALVVTDGGPPQYATTYLSLFVYRTGFEYLQHGVAAAATLVVFGLTAVAVAVQWRILRGALAGPTHGGR
ncbi:carbohydrate ABC transporter permease [Pilimelia anulata]|uniref:carbohydrate ABC transporter permease n=1 Tax=Pilimelia anulata TaxID=53371 RepID=UPI001664AF0C|nr:sugar ABC transporter permease [Pilimelia anulata]